MFYNTIIHSTRYHIIDLYSSSFNYIRVKRLSSYNWQSNIFNRLNTRWPSNDGYFHPCLLNKRNITLHKPRRQIGHKFEYIIGKHTRRRVNPPIVPIHPTKDVDKDMNHFETYRDLTLRWKKTTRSRKKRIRIARKWRQPRYINPTDQPTCMFVLHEKLPLTRKVVDYNNIVQGDYIPGEIKLDNRHNFDVYPPEPVLKSIKESSVETFCIFKSSAIHQHKVTKGDIVQIERLKRKEAGDKITFGTVLLVGSKDWTIIGKPTVPYARVLATVEQQTLCGEQLSFRYRKSRRISKFLKIRHWVTILRIDDIIVDPTINFNVEYKKPVRILDLWANRWLYKEELREDRSAQEEVCDDFEHNDDNYNKLGLTDAYRWYPDPYVKNWWK